MHRARRTDEGLWFRVSGLGFSVFRFPFSERRRIFPSPALFPGGEGVGGEGLRYGEPLLVRTSGIDVPRLANDVHTGDGGWQRSVACQSFGCPARQGSHPALLPVFPRIRLWAAFNPSGTGSCLVMRPFGPINQPASAGFISQPGCLRPGNAGYRPSGGMGSVRPRGRVCHGKPLQLLALLTTHVSRLTTPYD
jgi:hypothetical protein